MTPVSIRWPLNNPAKDINASTYSLPNHELRGRLVQLQHDGSNSNGFADNFSWVLLPDGVTTAPAPLRVEDLTSQKPVWAQPSKWNVSILLLTREDPAVIDPSSLQEQSDKRFASVKWMAEDLGVPPHFFDGALFQRDDLAINLSLPASQSPTGPTVLSGVYVTQMTGTFTTVFVRHTLDAQGQGVESIYVVHNPGPDLLDRIKRLAGDISLSKWFTLGVPNLLFIDSLILEGDNRMMLEFRSAYEQASNKLQSLTQGGCKKRESASVNPGGHDSRADPLGDAHTVSRAYGSKTHILTVLQRMLREVPDHHMADEARTYADELIADAQARRQVLMQRLQLLSSQAKLQRTAYARAGSASTLTIITMLSTAFVPAFLMAFFSVKDSSLDSPTSPENRPFAVSKRWWIYWLATVTPSIIVFLFCKLAGSNELPTLPSWLKGKPQARGANQTLGPVLPHNRMRKSTRPQEDKMLYEPVPADEKDNKATGHITLATVDDPVHDDD